MKHRFLTLISSLLLLTACSDSFLERAPEGNYVDVTYSTSDDALEDVYKRQVPHSRYIAYSPYGRRIQK